MRLAQALLGALLMVAGIAARVVATRHRPQFVSLDGTGWGGGELGRQVGWSATTYDLVHIASWALLIFGAVLILFALVREFRKVATA